MFYAKDSMGNRVHIADCSNSEKYFCPSCNSPLIIKAENSKLKRTHFAHVQKCTDGWTYEGMSEWHSSWQELFPPECREVVVTNNGETHRADVLINGVVIEFQHSPITAEEIAMRNTFYVSCGYKAVWVFDGTTEVSHYKVKDEESTQPCWNRKKVLFPENIPSGITVFIHLPYDRLAVVNDIEDHKFLLFQKLVPFVRINSFLKEYGALLDKDIDSISALIETANRVNPPSSITARRIIFLPYSRPRRRFRF